LPRQQGKPTRPSSCLSARRSCRPRPAAALPWRPSFRARGLDCFRHLRYARGSAVLLPLSLWPDSHFVISTAQLSSLSLSPSFVCFPGACTVRPCVGELGPRPPVGPGEWVRDQIWREARSGRRRLTPQRRASASTRRGCDVVSGMAVVPPPALPQDLVHDPIRVCRAARVDRRRCGRERAVRGCSTR